MAIVGNLPVTLTNGTTADATQVMQDFNYLQSQVNSNAAGLAQSNNFTSGTQTIAGDAIVTAAATQTLTNKTLTSPTITTPAVTGGTFSAPAVTGGTFSAPVVSSLAGTGVVVSGTYTPTLTASVNINSVTLNGLANYMRVGNVVSVVFSVNVFPTGGGAVVFFWSLPVSSNFTSLQDALGLGNYISSQPAAVFAVTSTNYAQVNSIAPTGGPSFVLHIMAQYVVK